MLRLDNELFTLRGSRKAHALFDAMVVERGLVHRSKLLFFWIARRGWRGGFHSLGANPPIDFG